MVHPSAVPVWKNRMLKHFFANNSAYTYAFNPTTYMDFDIYNIGGHPSVDRSGVGHAIRTSNKPVVFFLGYDVGPDTYNKLFIRHVVCCIAYGGDVMFLDMRNLNDISKTLQSMIEKSLSKSAGIPVSIVNAACLSGSCKYLQRFKDRHAVGWCIAWALFFLNNITNAHAPIDKKYIRNLYASVDKTLDDAHTNTPIEEWYLKFYRSLQR